MGKVRLIIGLGAIGVKVTNTAVSLGMEVYGYDPYVSVNAMELKPFCQACDEYVEEFYADCMITLRYMYRFWIPQRYDPTREAVNKMKRWRGPVKLCRDLLANEADVLEALKSGKVARYVSDFPNRRDSPAVS